MSHPSEPDSDSNVANANHSEFAVELYNLSKRFATVQANADISLNVRKGSIHAIVGENGAGKSTCMNMLYGLYAPDSGEIYLNGARQQFSSPSDAIDRGVGMVQQHFSLSGPESVLDNIILGAETSHKTFSFFPRALRPIDRKAAAEHITLLAEQHGLPVDLLAPVSSLTVGLQQRVEILKLLYRQAQVLILDEPTAVLTPLEIQAFFENLRSLKAQGKSILIITHKLAEVLALSDEVTVFRAGRIVGSRQTRECSEEDLAELMVGRKVKLRSTPEVVLTALEQAPLFKIENLSFVKEGRKKLDNVSLSIRPGEILGIAGVQGNGQSELEALLTAPRPAFEKGQAQGLIELDGKDLTHCDTSELFLSGLAIVSEDRQKNGLIGAASLEENFLLGLHHFPQFSSRGTILWDTLKTRVIAALKNFDIKAPGPHISSSSLSGGNQQKLIMARELEKKPKLLIAAQPTRGVDVGAIEFIHEQLRSLQRQGHAVLLISSELSEILSLSNRIVVFFEGHIAASFERKDASEQRLGLAMGGSALNPKQQTTNTGAPL